MNDTSAKKTDFEPLIEYSPLETHDKINADNTLDQQRKKINKRVWFIFLLLGWIGFTVGGLLGLLGLLGYGINYHLYGMVAIGIVLLMVFYFKIVKPNLIRMKNN